MKLSWQSILVIAGLAYVGVSGLAVVRINAQTQMPAPTPGQKAGDFFQNVSTSTLKELSVDDFMASMGVISAALGFDCSNCHPGAGTERVNWVVDTPYKRTARRMVAMVATINRNNFGGVQKVTCWTCHHGREVPTTSVMLDSWYSTPIIEDDDVVVADKYQPSPDQVFDKYLQALGGTQRLASLTSWVGTGSSVGYGGFGGNAAFTISVKAPNQRTTSIAFRDHPERPNSIWAFNGLTGWIKTPRGLIEEYEVAGGELDGLRFEAQLAFPGQIKQILNNWRVGSMRSIGDRGYVVVQGTGPRGFLATLYFDPQSGLLARMVRYSPAPVGRVQTQIDYADYRDVGGIKFPFELKFTWLGGRYTAKLTDIKVNVPIDESTFGRPQ